MAYIHKTLLTYPVSEQEIRAANPSISFPAVFTHDDYAWVFSTPKPAYNPLTQKIVAVQPILNQLGKYEEAWEIIALPPEDVDINTQLDVQRKAESKAANIEQLWRAAHDYEFARINGMAIGMLTVGVIANKPKSLAVKTWSKQIWDLYYTRKALITETMDAALLDFTSVGEMPHGVPELTQEVFP